MVAKIIAIANQKGGVGKTTTTVNLATAITTCNKNVLVVDLDAQGNASTGLGVEDRNDIISTFDLMVHTDDCQNAAVETPIPHLSIIPANMELAGIEVMLTNEVDREKKLTQSLQYYAGAYDYIFLDCPPNLGLITLNALVAADSVLVPLQTEFYALEGLSQILTTINTIKKSLNTTLTLTGILLTMYDKRNNLSKNVTQDVRSHLKDIVFDTVIPRNVRIAEAPSFSLPVILHDHQSIGAKAYIQLAKEFLYRLGELKKGKTHENTSQ